MPQDFFFLLLPSSLKRIPQINIYSSFIEILGRSRFMTSFNPQEQSKNKNKILTE